MILELRDNVKVVKHLRYMFVTDLKQSGRYPLRKTCLATKAAASSRAWLLCLCVVHYLLTRLPTSLRRSAQYLMGHVSQVVDIRKD